MHELIDFLKTNSALVMANPVPFATFAILFGSGGFLVGRYFLAERIANLESRIARRDEEIAAFKEGRSPAQDSTLAMVPIVGTSVIGPPDRQTTAPPPNDSPRARAQTMLPKGFQQKEDGRRRLWGALGTGPDGAPATPAASHKLADG